MYVTANEDWASVRARKFTVLVSNGVLPPEESPLNGSPYLREVTSTERTFVTGFAVFVKNGYPEIWRGGKWHAMSMLDLADGEKGRFAWRHG